MAKHENLGTSRIDRVLNYSNRRASAIALGAVVVFGLHHAAEASANDTGHRSGFAEVDQVNRINNTREARGEERLRDIECLHNIAEGWAEKMANSAGFVHNPDLASEITDKCGSGWTREGENIGNGAVSSPDIFEKFMASPHHKANILGTSWTDVGVGAYEDSSGVLWISQVYVESTTNTGNWKIDSTYPSQ